MREGAHTSSGKSDSKTLFDVWIERSDSYEVLNSYNTLIILGIPPPPPATDFNLDTDNRWPNTFDCTTVKITIAILPFLIYTHLDEHHLYPFRSCYPKAILPDTYIRINFNNHCLKIN